MQNACFWPSKKEQLFALVFPLCCGLPAGVCRGGTVRGVVCLKRFITAPHEPSLRLAAYRFSMKGPVHTCGNSSYL